MSWRVTCSDRTTNSSVSERERQIGIPLLLQWHNRTFPENHWTRLGKFRGGFFGGWGDRAECGQLESGCGVSFSLQNYFALNIGMISRYFLWAVAVRWMMVHVKWRKLALIFPNNVRVWQTLCQKLNLVHCWIVWLYWVKFCWCRHTHNSLALHSSLSSQLSFYRSFSPNFSLPDRLRVFSLPYNLSLSTTTCLMLFISSISLLSLSLFCRFCTTATVSGLPKIATRNSYL